MKAKTNDQLDHSKQLDVHKWSDYPEVNTWVNTLWDDYLARVNKVMQPGSLIFLVNGLSRQQGYSEKNQIYTNFDDYDLDGFSIVSKSIEQFRTHIPGQKEKPNIFYIARKK